MTNRKRASARNGRPPPIRCVMRFTNKKVRSFTSIYKFESFELFRGMLVRMNKNITSFLLKCLPISDAPGGEIQEARVVEEEVDLQTNRTGDEPVVGADGKPAPPKS